MDRPLVKSWISVESVAILTVSAWLFCIVCLYFLHRCYEVMINRHCSEVDLHPISARTNNTENDPTHDIRTQSRSLASNPARKLEVIIEHQEEENLSIDGL